MVQREVAERIAARPGGLSYLSVFVQYHATVRILRRVPPAAFEPAPAVDSAVIVVEPFAEDDRLAPADEDALWRLVQAAFRERRKMIHNVLTRQLPVPPARIAAALAAAEIDPDRRPQTLAVGEWLRLLEALGPIGADERGRRADRAAGGRGSRTRSGPLSGLGPVVRLAPAKVNLTLSIIGRRPDGFHALHSIMAPLGLADRLSLAPAAGSGTPSTSPATTSIGRRSGRWPTTSSCGRSRAARAAVGGARPTPALAARLEKRIPIAAGLAGGSSDAAAAARRGARGVGRGRRRGPLGRRALAPRRPPRVRRPVLPGRWPGDRRGSRRAGDAAAGAIRGEAPGILLVVAPDRDRHGRGLRRVRGQRRAAINGATRQTSEHLAGELQRGLTARTLHDRAGILASANDLFPASAAVEPAIVPFRRALARLTGRPIGLSGSGPTLWVLYPSLEAAQAAEVVVRAAIDDGSARCSGRPAAVRRGHDDRGSAEAARARLTSDTDGPLICAVRRLNGSETRANTDAACDREGQMSPTCPAFWSSPVPDRLQGDGSGDIHRYP